MTPTKPTEVQMKLARECAARLAQRRRDHDYAGWIREGRKDNDSEVQSALLAIQVTEARAQGLAGFGSSPAKAAWAFDEAFYADMPSKEPSHAD